jgi:hypothetical protein
LPEEVAALLGRSHALWVELIRHTTELAPRTSEVWKFAGPTIGWSLRLVAGERVLLYLTPGRDRITAGLVLGKKAFALAREVGLSNAAISVVEGARSYAEGHGIRLEVTRQQDAQVIKELLEVKVGPAAPKRPRKRA